MPLSWVEIDLAALRHNFFRVQERLDGSTRILGVVKSDAYGHGMLAVARELASCGAHFLGVSKFWEAQELRASGIDLPILVLLGLEPDDMEEAVRLQVRPAIYRIEDARLLSEAACRVGRPAQAHLKIDTGMGRLGLPWEKVAGFLDEILSLPGIRMEGVLSHFASADELDKSYSEWQLDHLRDVLRSIESRSARIPYVHIANSAGVLDLPGAHLQMVRPGIMLYGSMPSSETLYPADLRPVMHFKSRIIQLKDVPENQCIGYGRTHTTRCPSRVATVPVGYDDGYSRLLSNRGQVLVAGKRAPVIGRISMSMITVDTTDIPEAAEGSEVVLLGAQDGAWITADEIADLCGTISYEIYCLLGRHRFKVFLNDS